MSEIYVLLRNDSQSSVVAVHTTLQGAAMAMADKSPHLQRRMWVETVELIEDNDE